VQPAQKDIEQKEEQPKRQTTHQPTTDKKRRQQEKPHQQPAKARQQALRFPKEPQQERAEKTQTEQLKQTQMLPTEKVNKKISFRAERKSPSAQQAPQGDVNPSRRRQNHTPLNSRAAG
jgi:hypothetical protein